MSESPLFPGFLVRSDLKVAGKRPAAFQKRRNVGVSGLPLATGRFSSRLLLGSGRERVSALGRERYLTFASLQATCEYGLWLDADSRARLRRRAPLSVTSESRTWKKARSRKRGDHSVVAFCHKRARMRTYVTTRVGYLPSIGQRRSHSGRWKNRRLVVPPSCPLFVPVLSLGCGMKYEGENIWFKSLMTY